jgi:Zn-dependent protease with chaperone function
VALAPGSSDFSFDRRGSLSRWLRGLFGAQRFAPDQVLNETPEVDPILKPRIPMKSDNIDPALMLEFRSMGFSHAQEITAETHPELYLGWEELCRRAGFKKTLQLIVTDNADPNAIDASESEVVMSTGLLKMLTLREVLGVLGHELGHAKHDAKHNHRGWIDAAGAVGGAMIGNGVGDSIKNRFYGPIEFKPHQGLLIPTQKQPGWLVGSLLEVGRYTTFIVGGLVGWMIAHQFSVKPSELRADREGVMLSGDPEALISAFEKMRAMSDKQPSWKRFVGYAMSGYPTFDQRIRQIHEMSGQVPADVPPVYKMVELLANVQPPPETQNSVKPTTPGSRVGKIAENERVVYVPETTLLH